MGFQLKKIAILAFSSINDGGVYQYTRSIIDAFKEDNNNEYIIFCQTNDSVFDKYDLEVRKINKPKSNTLKKIVRLFQHFFIVRKPFFFTHTELDFFSDIDIFISPTVSAYPHFYLNKSFIFTLHDMQERYYPEFFSRYEQAVRWINNRTLAKSADKIICESSFVKDDIIKFTGASSDKLNIIQSPPPEDFLNYKFDEEKFEIVRLKYNLPQKYIFYPAHCWFHKNHIKLVEAFNIVVKDFDDVSLIFTGSQQNNYNNLIQRIDELELQDNVSHLGYIDYEDLAYLYKMSLMLVIPSLFESLSIPIYEAFALKVPVCSSDAVALPDQVGDAGLIFEAKNINDIAKTIILYLEDESLRIEKSRKGFDRVVGFNHEEYAKKLLVVLNE